MCQYRSWVLLGCHMLLGEQLLRVMLYFGAEAPWCTAGAGALHRGGQAISQALLPFPFWQTVVGLLRGGFTPQNPRKVVRRIRSSGVKQI